MNFKALLTVCIFAAGLIVISYVDSDAARFGRGRSFGSKPSMQKSMPAQSVQNKAPVAGAAAGAAGAAARPGLFGGMGGMFGGLLAGTFLGSMLGGGGMGGGGGGGFMNILLFGILGFVAYKLYLRFKANRSESAASSSGHNMGSMPGQGHTMARQQTGMNWDNFKDAPQSQGGATQSQVSLPEGFDAEDFLRGAKMAYSRLQSAWDKRDLSDLAQFVNPAVLEEIQKQLEDDPTPSTTDILLVNAKLLEVKEVGSEQIALVYFDVLLREDPTQTAPTQVKEVWHFQHAAGSDGSWKLDGIQQVE